MPFISYAQNFEDVMLWRALKHIENGFYVDVGANDPVDDSVTKFFYDAGWAGINIEPVPKYFSLLQEARPRDINLQVAAGDHNGTIKIFDVRSIRGWGTSSEILANQYAENGLDVEVIEVPEISLSQICSEHVGQKEIHFLKIDVEGMEIPVLRGMNFTVWRPWIILVESLDRESNSWNITIEEFLLSCGYRKQYHDGINDYYVAMEHKELESAFSHPPNVFDDIYKYREIVAQRKIDRLANEVDEAHQRLQATLSERDVIRVERDNLRITLNQVFQSRSWRLTQPLRWFYLQRKRLQEDGWYARSKAMYRRVFPPRNTVSSDNKSREHKANVNGSPDLIGESEADQLLKQTNLDSHRKVKLSEWVLATPGKFKHIVLSWLVSIMKLASDFARRTPGFKRLTFKLLHQYPSLELKLRRFYQENKSEHQLKPATWNTIVTNSGELPRPGSNPLDGINANQRTPLEANYHRFEEEA